MIELKKLTAPVLRKIQNILSFHLRSENLLNVYIVIKISIKRKYYALLCYTIFLDYFVHSIKFHFVASFFLFSYKNVCKIFFHLEFMTVKMICKLWCRSKDHKINASSPWKFQKQTETRKFYLVLFICFHRWFSNKSTIMRKDNFEERVKKLIHENISCRRTGRILMTSHNVFFIFDKVFLLPTFRSRIAWKISSFGEGRLSVFLSCFQAE